MTGKEDSVDLSNLKTLQMISLISPVVLFATTKKLLCEELFGFAIAERMVKCGTQFGTQKGAERAVDAVDAAHAVRNFLRKFSAC
jgi:hypothetical protein